MISKNIFNVDCLFCETVEEFVCGIKRRHKDCLLANTNKCNYNHGGIEAYKSRRITVEKVCECTTETSSTTTTAMYQFTSSQNYETANKSGNCQLLAPKAQISTTTTRQTTTELTKMGGIFTENFRNRQEVKQNNCKISQINSVTRYESMHPYGNNQRCRATFKCPSETIATVEFAQFEIELDKSCRYDYLKIRTSQTIAGKTNEKTKKLCGTTPNYKHTGNIIKIDFKSDKSTN